MGKPDRKTKEPLPAWVSCLTILWGAWILIRALVALMPQDNVFGTFDWWYGVSGLLLGGGLIILGMKGAIKTWNENGDSEFEKGDPRRFRQED